MSDAANQGSVEKLHAKFATELADQMEKGTLVASTDEEGKKIIRRVSPSASFLNVVRQFLRDCNIDCNPESPSPEVTSVKTRLEEIEDDEFPDFAQ